MAGAQAMPPAVVAADHFKVSVASRAKTVPAPPTAITSGEPSASMSPAARADSPLTSRAGRLLRITSTQSSPRIAMTWPALTKMISGTSSPSRSRAMGCMPTSPASQRHCT